MPGRILSSLVRSATAHPPYLSLPHEHSDRHAVRSASSPPSRKSEVFSSNRSGHDAHAPEQPERRLSFSLDHLIHPHHNRDRDRDRGHKEKRRSWIHLRSGEKPTDNHDALTAPGASLDLVIESPPLVLYGSPSRSTGALMSGRLLLSVFDSQGEVILKALRMQLTCTATTNKPVSKDCPACKSRTNVLYKWEFLTEPCHLKTGNHDYPFSHLFPGNLQATTHTALGSVSYNLSAYAVTAAGEELHLQVPVNIKRAIMPGPDKTSMRIFPPTNLVGRAIVPPVIHPIGNFPIRFSLRGVVEKREHGSVRWRLRKMMWRIEEHQTILSSACCQHCQKVPDGRGILHQVRRIIGNGEQKNGWKTDFDTVGGEINIEFEAHITPGSKPTCNLDPPPDGGLEIKHDLVVEQIVAEEYCPNSNVNIITPTGSARVLRMVFQLHVTECAGLGISWDEEMPPVYTDVPASPPGYITADKSEAAVETYTVPPSTRWTLRNSSQ
ncbi:protein LDB19 [Paracoccidioides brasiliensis Pb18]|uniref:Protein LDB19 n=1 Tax=Paracoccidioides brasiliensis (strain Pb18) TaxID=502780 RepID=C1GEH9_PARBD|nr:protein LDB19 [Paracoccidioides brasiliensis Pb18]EEH49586.2 protein LDB19 [Paracoccidioides brasiliensis Pb18]ODH53174.1 protein LDB19 [Paracoccidioides brasiliensis]